MPLLSWTLPLVFSLWPPAHSTKCPRVVSGSPQWTEVLFQLGKGECLVGASQFSDYPEAAKKVPRIGPLFAPNIEVILQLKPEWVINDPLTRNPWLGQSLLAIGAKEYSASALNPKQLFDTCRSLLKEIFLETSNEYLKEAEVSFMKRALAKSTFRFMAFAWADPPILIGPNTFLSEILAQTGGLNILPKEWQTPYPQLSDEWLIAHTTPVIFHIREDSASETRIKSFIKKTWPKKVPLLVPLAPEKFSRSSFTPLHHIDELRQVLESAL